MGNKQGNEQKSSQGVSETKLTNLKHAYIGSFDARTLDEHSKTRTILSQFSSLARTVEFYCVFGKSLRKVYILILSMDLIICLINMTSVLPSGCVLI